MTLLDRYLGTRFAATLLRSLVAVAFLFVFIDLMTHRREDIMEHNVPAGVVAEYYLCLLPKILRDYQVAAVGVLVTSLLVLGKLAQNREIVAMLAGGIGLRRYMRAPVFVVAAFAAVIAVATETVGVDAAKRARDIEIQYFGEDLSDKPEAVSWANLQGGWTCHVMAFDRATLTGSDALLLKLGTERVEEIEAERFYWDPDGGQWMLEDGAWSTFFPQESMEVESRPIESEPAPIVEEPELLFAAELDPATRSLTELRNDIEYALAHKIPAQRLRVDFHARFALPVLSLLMLWVGVPFALKLGRGGLSIGLAASVGIGLLYLMVHAAAVGMGYLGRMDPLIAAWLANAAFGALGAILTLRTVS